MAPSLSSWGSQAAGCPSRSAFPCSPDVSAFPSGVLPRPVVQSCGPSAGLSYPRPSVLAAHVRKPRPRTLQTLKLNVSKRISLSAPYPTKSLAHVD